MDETNETPTAYPTSAIDYAFQIDDTVRLQRQLLEQQVKNAQLDGLLKKTMLETAMIELKIKRTELERREIEMQRLRHGQPSRKNDSGLAEDYSLSKKNELVFFQIFKKFF